MKRSVVYCIIIAFVISMIGPACSKNPRARYHSRADRMRFIKEHGLDRLPPTDVPIEVNERVIAWMDYFSGSGARHFSRYLRRSGRFKKQMQAILKKYGLPKDLFYVALIESGFNTHARSHAAAVGPWQFIRGTGKRYGLRIDSWVDERRDPVKSTHAAARYLRDLYREFDHWYLAMAGYNAGEGRVRKAIKNSGSKSFWVHADPKGNHLRPETRDYVPKYIAATIMAKMPEMFGFGDVDYDKPDEYEIVQIPTQTDLEVVATCAGVKRYDLEELNPEIKLGATPPGVTNYKLRLPKGRKDKFLVAYGKVPKDERIRLVVHTVKHREKLSTVARKYGVSTRHLASANGISRRAHLRVGQQLVIPIGAAFKARVAKGDFDGSETVKKRITYRVRRGDTLGKIAHKYGVTTSQLRRWNRLNRKGTIRVGQRLKLYKTKRVRVASKASGSKSATGSHKVHRGETLSTIAQKYGCSVSDLRSWNGISGNKIRAGQHLKVSASEPKVAKASSTKTSSGSAASKTSSKSTGGGASHTLASGQTLGHVAEIYGVSTKDLMRWNNIKDPRHVRAGRKLVINGGSKKKFTPAKASAEPFPEPVETKTIAEKPESEKGTDVAMAPKAAAEQSLNVEPPAPATKSAPTKIAKKDAATTYKIKSGDSLWTIARKHGVSVNDIKKWNGIGKTNKIKPGQKIVIKSK